ncbi:MAG: hypothetical protein GXY41_00220 [Phycisphaerae bacterium]|nr:hypothetical protein [Phycisphaerae bacterium]
MEHTSSLGLYLSRGRAIAVWLSEKDSETITRAQAFVPTEGESAQTMALQAARAIARHDNPVEQIFVALDCSYYTQYSLHSEFSDVRQIESTIKFDAEEAAAADAMNLAVTFTVTGPLPTGAEVMAFSADRQTITDILLDVQEGGLDPAMIEPDAVCLARAMEHMLHIAEQPDTLFVLTAERNCYFIQPGNNGYAPKIRSFLLGAQAQRTASMMREILLAITGWDDETPLKKVVFVHPPEGVDCETLAQRTALEIRVESAVEKVRSDKPLDPDIPTAELLMAVGAAFAPLDKARSADFRRDFMPYQGKRKILESSLRLTCISLAVLFVAIGIFFQFRTWRTNVYAADINEKLAEEYRGAMYGANPPTTEAINSRLRRTLVNVRRVQDGLGPGDDKSVPAKLTFLLEAINSCPPEVDVKIQQIMITDNTMSVKGDTNSRRSTLDLFDAVKKHPRLKLGTERMSISGNRDTFDFTVEPAQ